MKFRFGSGTTPRSTWWSLGAIAAIAFTTRCVATGGLRGLFAYHGYDDGVYFSAALALSHGRLPYRDFIFLHPPGIAVALAPFGMLAQWLTDPVALAGARITFWAVGALNAVLVAHLARRWGPAAAWGAGLMYAVLPAAVHVEGLTLLEPLGTLTMLGAVALLDANRGGAGPAAGTAMTRLIRWQWLAGALLGFGVTVKIWNVVPAAVILGWQLVTAGHRAALRVAGGGLAAALAVVAPFAVAAPSAMARYVVFDQIGRPRDAGTAHRIESLTGADATSLEPGDQLRLAMVICVVIAAAAVLACMRGRGRLWVALAAAQTVTLLASPSFYRQYAAFNAAAVVLVLVAGASAVPALRVAWRHRGPTTQRGTRAVPVALVAATVLVLGLSGVVQTHRERDGEPVSLPTAQIAARLPARGCVAADSPGALVLLNVMSHDLALGCPVPVDLSGQTYDTGVRSAHGHPVPRDRNQPWQRAAIRYLTSAPVAVLVRPQAGNGFDAQTRAELASIPTIRYARNVRLLIIAQD